MPLSLYLVAFPCPDRPDKVLAYSTKRASLCLVPAAAWDRLAAGEDPAGVLGDSAAALERVGVLAADPEAERREVFGYLDVVNAADPGVTAAVILGMACNFACPYCYEGSGKGAGAMGEETADRMVAFVAERLAPGKTKVTLDFYGGEPLLYLPTLRRIAEALKPRAEARGARFTFTLVTNGSLLTPATVEDLLPLGLGSVKVTLDGPPEHHDRSRPARGGGATFGTIVANLKAVADLVPVGVGGNFTPETWPEFPRLLDLLEAEGLGPGRIAQVQFNPVLASPGACGGCASSAEPWLAEASVVLREAVLRRGYRTPKPTPSPCMIDLEAAFTVNWDGTLTKCPALIGDPRFAVGDVWAGFSGRDPFTAPRWRTEPECRDCTYLPLCFGGCRYLRLQGKGDVAGVDCQRPFLDATLKQTLFQDLRYRHP